MHNDTISLLSSLMNVVVDYRGSKIGTVKDFLFTPNGQLIYLIVTAEYLESADNYYAIPFSNVNWRLVTENQITFEWKGDNSYLEKSVTRSLIPNFYANTPIHSARQLAALIREKYVNQSGHRSDFDTY